MLTKKERFIALLSELVGVEGFVKRNSKLRVNPAVYIKVSWALLRLLACVGIIIVCGDYIGVMLP